MRQPPVQATPQPDTPRGRSLAARPRPAGQQSAARAGCGHTRYTKGCDICALAGIYQDHLSQPGITPAQRSRSSGSTRPATRPACSNCGSHGDATAASPGAGEQPSRTSSKLDNDQIEQIPMRYDRARTLLDRHGHRHRCP